MDNKTFALSRGLVSVTGARLKSHYAARHVMAVLDIAGNTLDHFTKTEWHAIIEDGRQTPRGLVINW